MAKKKVAKKVKTLKKVKKRSEQPQTPETKERTLPPAVSGRLADDYYDRFRADQQRFSGYRGDTY